MCLTYVKEAHILTQILMWLVTAASPPVEVKSDLTPGLHQHYRHWRILVLVASLPRVHLCLRKPYVNGRHKEGMDDVLLESTTTYHGKRVVRRKTEDITTGDIIEDTPVSEHEDPHWYRNVPNIIKIKTTFYYVPT